MSLTFGKKTLSLIIYSRDKNANNYAFWNCEPNADVSSS